MAGALSGGAPTTLHVTNGDSTASSLRAAGLEGEVLAWRDVLHEGAVPAGLSVAELRGVRGAQLEGAGLARAAEVVADFEDRDRMLEQHAGGSLVLWFEADLYDQLQLIQVLDRLAELGADPSRVTLVSIGEYPGIAHFGGLGELGLAALLGLEGVQLSPSTFELAREAWRAFTAPEPAALPAMALVSTPELRFLGEAFGRLMQEYPSRSDGLSLTERRILLVLAEGASTPAQVFSGVWRRERRPYLGDMPCFAIVSRLAAGPHPLLAVENEVNGDFGDASLSITDEGRRVLAGLGDHVLLNGLDRWIGGVQLLGRQPAWRYDERLETVTGALAGAT
jgi:hypothetical protein